MIIPEVCLHSWVERKIAVKLVLDQHNSSCGFHSSLFSLSDDKIL